MWLLLNDVYTAGVGLPFRSIANLAKGSTL